MVELQSNIISYFAKLPGVRSARRKGKDTIAVTYNKGEDLLVYLGNLLDTLSSNRGSRLTTIENFAVAVIAPLWSIRNQGFGCLCQAPTPSRQEPRIRPALMLETTKRALMVAGERTSTILDTQSAMGFRIALDD